MSPPASRDAADIPPKDDTIDHCERRRLQNREAQRRFRQKKAQEREAENRIVPTSSSLLRPQSSSATISNLSSEETTLESIGNFTTHVQHTNVNGLITGSMGQYTPVATPRRIALQDSRHPDNETEFDTPLSKDFINGRYALRPSSLPEHLPGADVLATQLGDLGVYPTPAHSFSPGLLTPDNLDPTFVGIDDIDYLSYSRPASLSLQGNSLFREGEGFLHDDFMFVHPDPFNTFGSLQSHHQSVQHPMNASVPDTPVSQSPIQSRHTSHVDLTKSNIIPQEPTRSTSMTNRSRTHSISRRSKSKGGSDEDQGSSDDRDGDGPDDGRPLLHIPVENGHEGIVRILLGNGADVNQQESSKGFTALHLAISHKHEAVLRLLIESGATLDISDHLGRTPLHLAAEIGNEAGVRILLAHGADLSVKAGRSKKRSTD